MDATQRLKLFEEIFDRITSYYTFYFIPAQGMKPWSNKNDVVFTEKEINAVREINNYLKEQEIGSITPPSNNTLLSKPDAVGFELSLFLNNVSGSISLENAEEELDRWMNEENLPKEDLALLNSFVTRFERQLKIIKDESSKSIKVQEFKNKIRQKVRDLLLKAGLDKYLFLSNFPLSQVLTLEDFRRKFYILKKELSWCITHDDDYAKNYYESVLSYDKITVRDDKFFQVINSAQNTPFKKGELDFATQGFIWESLKKATHDFREPIKKGLEYEIRDSLDGYGYKASWNQIARLVGIDPEGVSLEYSGLDIINDDIIFGNIKVLEVNNQKKIALTKNHKFPWTELFKVENARDAFFRTVDYTPYDPDFIWVKRYLNQEFSK